MGLLLISQTDIFDALIPNYLTFWSCLIQMVSLAQAVVGGVTVVHDVDYCRWLKGCGIFDKTLVVSVELWLCLTSAILSILSLSYTSMIGSVGNGMQLQTQLELLGLLAASWKEGVQWRAMEHRREDEGGRMCILKQRGCLLTLAADPTCRWSTQSPGRSKSQGPEWTSLWNGNGV